MDLVPEDEVPETGWKQVLEGEDERGRIIALVHEDTPVLRRMTVFDVIINNADRKGDHVLAMGDGHRYGVDHGLTFTASTSCGPYCGAERRGVERRGTRGH